MSLATFISLEFEWEENKKKKKFHKSLGRSEWKTRTNKENIF